MKAEKHRVKVFLSHTAEDRALARQAMSRIKEYAGAHVFTTDMLSAAGDWQEELKAEIRESDLFALILSSEALDSSLVLQELGAAWALDKPIAVLLARPELRAPVNVSSDYIIPIERLEEPEVVRHIFDLSRSTPEAGPAASK